ncbi:MAG: M14 family zinc carboxypeptidase, partial [Candidatus Aminicenantes bacterium]|nr:M14 family zinc carboxypeptidase [Candidatus Aminicenantes bacterium]
MRQNAKFLRTLQKISLVLVILVLITQIGQAQRKVTSPEEFFGFQLGSDRRIARWDKIVDYFKLLQEESSKIKVIDMGPSTMGNPFLVIIISSLENLANLDHLQEVNAKISDPRGIAEAEIKELVKEGKAVICQSMSLHATEIGGTQMAPELTYDLLSREDEETQRILDNVLFFLIPSFNPDGQIMVTDWYNKTLGTEYEGASLPWLYHKYVGHDNNRDGDFLNMIESVYAAKIMYRDWIPQAYIDH